MAMPLLRGYFLGPWVDLLIGACLLNFSGRKISMS